MMKPPVQFVRRAQAIFLSAALLLFSAGCQKQQEQAGPENAVDSSSIVQSQESENPNSGESEKQEEEGKLKLIFTIDTEDKYGEVPNLIECDFGDAGECGVNYIMDTLEKYGMRGVFFVNIYEHVLYSGEYEAYMENLVRRIAERGHEVGLHAHKEESFPFYQREIYNLDLEDQKQVIEYGCSFIEEHTGKRPLSFRGGGYYCNDDTFTALEASGIRYDSSYYYGKAGNRFMEYRSLNQVCRIGNIIEFPVIQTIRSDGIFSKLDFNNMSYEDIIAVLEQMKEREGFSAAQMMFHSFSFMDQSVKDGVMPFFQEGTHPAYGPSESLSNKFMKVLDYIDNDPDIEVLTFEQYDERQYPLPDIEADGIFYVQNERGEEAAKGFQFERANPNFKEADLNAPKPDEVIWFTPQDVELTADGMSIQAKNLYENGKMQYAWYIIDQDSCQEIYKRMYETDNSFSYTFEKSGNYLLKAFVQNANETKLSLLIAEIQVDASSNKVDIKLSNRS